VDQSLLNDIAISIASPETGLLAVGAQLLSQPLDPWLHLVAGFTIGPIGFGLLIDNKTPPSRDHFGVRADLAALRQSGWKST